MLKYFTWQQFLVAALVLSIIWYAVIILLFYRKSVQDYLSGKHKDDVPPEPLGHAWDEEFEDEPLNDENELMGKSALPEGMTKLSMAQFGFAPKARETEVPKEVNENKKDDFENEKNDANRRQQQSIVPDVLEELKSIFHILETEQGTKEDFISLFGLVSSKYPSIKGTVSERAINEYIRENLPFSITEEELEDLWT